MKCERTEVCWKTGSAMQGKRGKDSFEVLVGLWFRTMHPVCPFNWFSIHFIIPIVGPGAEFEAIETYGTACLAGPG